MSVWKLPAGLVMLLTLAGCQTMIPPIDRPGTGKMAINQQLDRICVQWKAQTYDSKRDTPQTVKEARANNAARRGFGCK